MVMPYLSFLNVGNRPAVGNPFLQGAQPLTSVNSLGQQIINPGNAGVAPRSLGTVAVQPPGLSSFSSNLFGTGGVDTFQSAGLGIGGLTQNEMMTMQALQATALLGAQMSQVTAMLGPRANPTGMAGINMMGLAGMGAAAQAAQAAASKQKDKKAEETEEEDEKEKTSEKSLWKRPAAVRTPRIKTPLSVTLRPAKRSLRWPSAKKETSS